MFFMFGIRVWDKKNGWLILGPSLVTTTMGKYKQKGGTGYEYKVQVNGLYNDTNIVFIDFANTDQYCSYKLHLKLYT